MNTEILDYLKALSKREFFFANMLSTICSLIVIIAGITSLVNGASMNTYAVMFGGATLTLGINAYKGFRSKSKNAWVFTLMALAMLGITGLFAYAILVG